MLAPNSSLGPGYSLELRQNNPIKHTKNDWLGTLLPIFVAFFVVIFFSWMLVLVEAQFVNQSAQASAFSEIKCSNFSVSSLIYSGYASDELNLRETYFSCTSGGEQLSWWHQFLGIKTAAAADYSAEKMLVSTHVLEMNPGETKEFTVAFKNTGSVTWTRDTGPYISIYTYDPKYRTSRFQDASWKLREQPTKITQALIPTGHLAFVTWNFQAPTDIEPGWYTETFHLAAEDLLWIPGGRFDVKVHVEGEPTETPVVIEEPTPIVTAPAETSTQAQTAQSTEGYEAKLLLKSHQSIIAKAGQTIEFTAGIKNYGSTTWTHEKIIAPDMSAASSGLDDFYHSSWKSRTVVSEASQTLAPGHLGFFKFIFKAPTAVGSHGANFKLVANDVNVPGGDIYIPITVTDDGGYVAPTQESVTCGDEPIVRIGLYDLEGNLQLTANKSYKVRTSCGNDLGTYSAGEVVTASYDKSSREYSFSGNSSYRGSCYIRFEPVSGQNIFELTNYEKRPAWNRAYNDNKFRGIIELRASETNYPWVINELPIEDYLKGLAETSNYSPLEFQKALITAARSYIFHHYENPYKHEKGHFTVDATYDQVYRGYGSEVRVPKLTEAVEQTRGQIVHYDGEPVFTPYYSRSDGRTRSYKEVWGIYNGRDYGWLQSVPAPYDAAAGNTLWGHGVGMACTDAIGMANDDYGWDEILKYYYTNITLKKLW